MARAAILRVAGLIAFSMLFADGATAQDSRGASTLVQANPEAILRALGEDPADLTFVNFWATWCAPCLEEFPEIVRFAAEFGSMGVRVAFVSVDSPEDIGDVKAFLGKSPWPGLSFLKSGKDHEFVSGFQSDWNGAVPATLVYDAKIELVGTLLRQTTYEELVAMTRHHLPSRFFERPDPR